MAKDLLSIANLAVDVAIQSAKMNFTNKDIISFLAFYTFSLELLLKNKDENITKKQILIAARKFMDEIDNKK